MPFFLDTQETVQRFGNSIVEFRSLLDLNHIRYGSPNDLFEFARTLESSNQFRLDLSALVKSVVNRETEEILLTDMMSIIAASVGGESVTETHADINKPTNTLMEFLLGTGCWRQFGSPSRPMSRSPAQQPIKSPVTESPPSIEEASSSRNSRPVAPISSAAAHPEDRTSLLDISNELRQTLSRLENNTQQVKHHLDSIEQRISKIEPAPEVPPPRTSAGLEPLVHRGFAEAVSSSFVQSTVEDVPASEPELPTRGRAVFSHPTHLDESRTEEDDDFSSPTFAYGTEKGRSIVPIWIFLALAAIGAAVFLFLHFGHGDRLLKAGLSRLKSDDASFSAPASSPPATAPSAVSAPVPGSTSFTTAAAPSHSPTQSQSEAPKDIPGTTSTRSSGADAAGSNVSPGDRAMPDNSKIRYVPANVMEGYLISAPRPEYPPQARMNHIEGQVALQATISRRGSIETLHVIKGPPSLRAAAVDAARNWRYRPYSADGQAVKVATTVYVDFTLRPPPSIVH